MNPFTYNAPVAPERMINRESEAQTLLDRALEGRSMRLSGPRRFGKTTLLMKLIADSRSMGLTAVYVNFFGVLSLEDIAIRIQQAYNNDLQGSLRKWYSSFIRNFKPVISIPGVANIGLNITPQTKDTPKVPGDVLEMLHSLLDLPVRVYEKTHKRTVVVFDEFQDVLAGNPSIDGLIRSRIEFHREEASYVFAGSNVRLMSELFGRRERAFYGQATPLELGPLPDDALALYISDHFSQTGKNVDQALPLLLDFVRGHPQRAMLSAYHLWNATSSGSAADEEAWDRALVSIYSELRDSFSAAWLSLDQNERRLMTVIAKSKDGTLHKDLLSKYGIARTTAQKARDRVVASGDLVVHENGAATIVDPLFAVWLSNDRQGLLAA